MELLLWRGEGLSGLFQCPPTIYLLFSLASSGPSETHPTLGLQSDAPLLRPALTPRPPWGWGLWGGPGRSCGRRTAERPAQVLCALLSFQTLNWALHRYPISSRDDGGGGDGIASTGGLGLREAEAWATSRPGPPPLLLTKGWAGRWSGRTVSAWLPVI